MGAPAPAIRFFEGLGGQRIAYATQGTGVPLVCAAWWVSHVQKDWDEPGFRRFFEGLSAHRTVVRYDRPGSGLSDRQRARVDLPGEVATLAGLIDTLGAPQVDLLGVSCGGPTAITYAADHPTRVRRLVLVDSFVDGTDVGGPEVRDALMALVRAHWGLGSATLARLFAPDLSSDAIKRLGKSQRATASADMAARLLALTFDARAGHAAARVRAPALVLHRRHDQAVPLSAGTALAASLPDAALQTLEGNAHVPWLGEIDDVLATMLRHLEPEAAAPGSAPPARQGSADVGHWLPTADGSWSSSRTSKRRAIVGMSMAPKRCGRSAPSFRDSSHRPWGSANAAAASGTRRSGRARP